MIIHPIPPVFDESSRVLVLGSFPSVKSREAQFFYGHPQNRFWKVLAGVFGEEVPNTIPEKRAFLLRNHVAVWDVIHSCDITGSSDSSIRNVTPNDIGKILSRAPIEAIYINGKTAGNYYDKYVKKTVGRDAVVLPSTSPANAAWNLDRLLEAWKILRMVR
ncbi:MAG: DNA-deoxyinosine glycosylase [Clostridiales bacterium]|nr:DNA-deoxyinosine glycosylase [Clostridiales bacterium]